MSKNLNIRLSVEQAELLTIAAQKEGLTVSEFVRNLTSPTDRCPICRHRMLTDGVQFDSTYICQVCSHFMLMTQSRNELINPKRLNRCSCCNAELYQLTDYTTLNYQPVCMVCVAPLVQRVKGMRDRDNTAYKIMETYEQRAVN